MIPFRTGTTHWYSLFKLDSFMRHLRLLLLQMPWAQKDADENVPYGSGEQEEALQEMGSGCAGRESPLRPALRPLLRSSSPEFRRLQSLHGFGAAGSEKQVLYRNSHSHWKKFRKDDWEFIPKNVLIHENEVLGAGAFATVYRSTIIGTARKGTKKTSVQGRFPSWRP